MRHAILRELTRRIMRAWMSSRLDALSSVPHPDDSLSVHVVGEEPARVLMLGGAALMGHGVLSADLALQGSIARQVTATTGRGIDIQVIADMSYTATKALDDLRATDLTRYDAVVLMLGSTEAILQARPAHWGAELESILAELAPSGIPVVVSTIPGFLPRHTTRASAPRRIAESHAQRLNGILRYVAGLAASVGIVEFDASLAGDGDRFRSAETFSQWARQFSPVLAEVLTASLDRVGSRRESDEAHRQASLDRAHIVGTSPEERFDQIVHSARQVFGAAASGLAFLDHDRQWFKAREGFDVDEIPRAHAVCDITISSDRVFVVPNMLDDPRFATNPYVLGPEHVRFYAGYRIASPDGEHIGALCIFDTRPRDFTPQDAVLLRELALMAQDEVWAERPVAPVA